MPICAHSSTDSYILQFHELFSSHEDIDAFAVSALRVKVLHYCANFGSTETECGSPVVEKKQNVEDSNIKNEVPDSELGSRVAKKAQTVEGANFENKMMTKDIAVLGNNAEAVESCMIAMGATATPHENDVENMKATASTGGESQARRDRDLDAEGEVKRLKKADGQATNLDEQAMGDAVLMLGA